MPVFLYFTSLLLFLFFSLGCTCFCSQFRFPLIPSLGPRQTKKVWFVEVRLRASGVWVSRAGEMAGGRVDCGRGREEGRDGQAGGVLLLLLLEEVAVAVEKVVVVTVALLMW